MLQGKFPQAIALRWELNEVGTRASVRSELGRAPRARLSGLGETQWQKLTTINKAQNAQTRT